MINFVQEGDALTLTAPTGGVVSGQPYQINQLLVIAAQDADAGDPFIGKTTGVFDVTKPGSQAWAVGELVYFDQNNRYFTNSPGDDLLCGHAVAVVGSGAGETTGRVRLDGIARDNLTT